VREARWRFWDAGVAETLVWLEMGQDGLAISLDLTIPMKYHYVNKSAYQCADITYAFLRVHDSKTSNIPSSFTESLSKPGFLSLLQLINVCTYRHTYLLYISSMSNKTWDSYCISLPGGKAESCKHPSIGTYLCLTLLDNQESSPLFHKMQCIS
jgi:hypothetical protein